MSVEVIKESFHVARKSHDCQGCEMLNTAAIQDWSLGFGELRDYAKAKKGNFKINKGERYLKQVNKYEGTIYTFKVKPEIHDICIKYDAYEV